jgi:hypothetical protein
MIYVVYTPLFHYYHAGLSRLLGPLELFEAEARQNNIYEFSPYRKENTTLHHYKDQLVNAV